MNEPNQKVHYQSRVKMGSNSFLFIALIAALVFGSLFYFYKIKDDATSSVAPHQDVALEELNNKPPPASGTATQKATLQATTANPSSETMSTPEQEGDVVQDHSAALHDVDPLDHNTIPADSFQPQIDTINAFYARIDQQHDLQNLGLDQPSKIYFSALLQKLAYNPPVIFGEAKDLFTILQNTAHFFRVLGKNNILILKEILEEEKDSFEQVLKAFYDLTSQPAILEKEYSLSISTKALTEYAAFFLNTMGGRLYLFRRDSTSRMLVSYYAILMIDRANNEGNGGHGIDIRSSIRSLIDEIENGGDRLQLKEQYLDALYDLQEKYN